MMRVSGSNRKFRIEGGIPMVITEMTSKECQEILARTGFGRLGCTRNNQPYVVPIYFAYEPDHLYGFSTFGQKY